MTTREQLTEWYWTDRLSMREIGERCGVTTACISANFRKLGIAAKMPLEDGRFLWKRGGQQPYERIPTPEMRASAHPDMIDIAWAAGVYEGEGCCLAYASRVRPEHITLRMQLTQKDRWILDRLQRLFGGSVKVRKGYGPHTTDLFAWNLYGPRARGFVFTIFTWLSPRRREQIRRAVQR